MSDKVEYEPVPESDLHEYQRFHVNKAKTQDVEPYQGGIAAEVLGIPAIAGAKTVQGVMKSNALKVAKNLIEKGLAPAAEVAKATPSEVITPQGGGAWNEKLAGNVAPGSQMSKPWLDINRRMAETVGPGGELAGGQIYKGSVMVPPGVELPSSTPAAPAPLTPTQRAMQVVKGTASSPIVSGALKGAGTVGGLWEGGENLVRLWNHFKHDQPARELLDVAGVVSNAATLLPTPASPWSNIAGAGLSIPIGMYQRHLEEQDAAQKKATGGLANLR